MSNKKECVKPDPSYLSVASCVHHLTEPAIRSAISALHLPPGSHGLDAGSGIGDHTLWLAEAVSPGGRVTGIDTSLECLSRSEAAAARSCLEERVTFQYGDLNDLPFEDDTFDWVWIADSLWPGPRSMGFSSEDPLPILKELLRVIRPAGTVAVLFWSSQKLLPGYPLLEGRLNATCAANFPYAEDTAPELHILRALGWLQEAGVEEPKAHTFVADLQAPLDGESRDALKATFQMLWRGAGPEMTAADWAEFQRLCLPESRDFILNVPGYYAFITYSLFWGRVPGPSR